MTRQLKYSIPYPLPGSARAARYEAIDNGYGFTARTRFHVRVLKEERELIERAAEITGCSLTELMRWSTRFVCEAVIKEAEENECTSN